MFLKKKQPLIFALRRHKHLKSLTCSQGHTTKPITPSLNINTARVTAQVRKYSTCWLVSPLLEGEMIYFCSRPAVPPLVGFFLRLTDKSSDILETVTLGVSVEHFGISLQTDGLTKGLQTGGKKEREKKKAKLSRMSRNESRHCTAVQNSAILFGGRW